MKRMPRSSTRLAPVDGLRGVAALLVVLHHVWTSANTPAIGALIVPFDTAQTGVDLFFVISGFCLFYPLAAPGATPHWPTFFRNRARRIFPPYYSALVLFIVVPPFVALIARSWGDTTAHPIFPDWHQIWSHALLLHTFSPDTFFGIDGPMWSLGVEMQFYLVFPLAVWLVYRYRAWGLVLIALATIMYRTGLDLLVHHDLSPAVAAATNQWTLRVKLTVASDFFLGRWLQFALGMLVALIVRRSLPSTVTPRRERLAWLLIGSLLLLRQSWHRDLIDQVAAPLADLSTGLAFALLLLLACMPTSISHRVFSHPVPVAIGLISYSLYLVHQPLLAAFGSEILQLNLPPYASMIVIGVCGVPMVLAAAALFFHFFERPFLRSIPRTPLREAGHLPASTRAGVEAAAD